MVERKRQQQEAVFENLLALPWYLNAGFAVAVYFPIKYLPVFIQPQSPTASAAIAVASDLAVFVALIPFAAAIISGVRAIASGSRGYPEVVTEPFDIKAEMARDDVEQNKQHETEGREALAEAGETRLQKPETMSLELLRQIEWKRFEALCRAYLEAKGGRAESTDAGPDGVVDIRLFKGKSEKPIALVQCKAWNACPLEAEPVRELFEAMAAEGISAGILMTTGTYAREARDFAKGKKLILISGNALVTSILEMPEEIQGRLLDVATE